MPLLSYFLAIPNQKNSQSPSGFSLTFAPKLLRTMLIRLLYKKATLAYAQPKTFRAVNQHLIVLLGIFCSSQCGFMEL